jgi:3-oxoacyl-[acyl-carrier-protein] synthase II
MAKFAQYAMAAAEEALEDAGWKPTTHEQKEVTGVCLGSGIGNFDEIYDTVVAYEQGVRFILFHLFQHDNSRLIE